MIEIVHLDANLTMHCNFSCTACSHVSPLHKPWFMALEDFERDLLALKPILKVRNLNLVGGEPLLHPRLLDFMRLAKSIRIDEQTHVITNGSLLPRMPEEFWQELEFLKISIYAKLSNEVVDLARAKGKQYGFGIEATEFKDFYLQLTAPTDGRQSFENCPWKTDCYTVHKGHFTLCPQSTFFPKTLMSLPEHIDGLPLEGITEEKLRAFMNRTEPFSSCTICTGSRAHSIPWRESARDKWIAEATL